MKLYEQHVWVAEDGTQIYELRPFEVAAREREEKYARVQLPVRFFVVLTHTINCNGQPMVDQFKADIEAGSLTEAFEKIPQIIETAPQKRIAELQKQAAEQERLNRNKIVLPNGQTLPPAGKPKTKIA